MQRIYCLLSLTRGYKAGGFNSEVNLPTEQYRQFDTEYQWNYEVGAKFYSQMDNLLIASLLSMLIAKILQLKVLNLQ